MSKQLSLQGIQCFPEQVADRLAYRTQKSLPLTHFISRPSVSWKEGVERISNISPRFGTDTRLRRTRMTLLATSSVIAMLLWIVERPR